MKNIVDKMFGCLYGQAIGNAMGIQSEFMSRTEVADRYAPKLYRYNQDYPNGFGEWDDDDTKQMLCILDEIVESKNITAKGLALKLVNWLESDGRGCGNLVYQVLTHRNYLDNPISAAYDRWNLAHQNAAPNGALMRTSVVGLWPKDVEKNAVTACRVTHYDPRCVGSCVIATMIIYNLVWESSELTYHEIKRIGDEFDGRIAEWIDLAFNSSDISMLELDDSSGMGYTLRTLSAALWCYWHAKSFEEGMLTVVNEGGDADTNAAIACAILGAKYGYDSIPKYYIENLNNESAYREIINHFISIALNETE